MDNIQKLHEEVEIEFEYTDDINHRVIFNGNKKHLLIKNVLVHRPISTLKPSFFIQNVDDRKCLKDLIHQIEMEFLELDEVIYSITLENNQLMIDKFNHVEHNNFYDIVVQFNTKFNEDLGAYRIMLEGLATDAKLD
mgnify:CR=1 FL=1